MFVESLYRYYVHLQFIIYIFHRIIKIKCIGFCKLLLTIAIELRCKKYKKLRRIGESLLIKEGLFHVMVALIKEQYEPLFTAEYKNQKIAEYKEKHKQMFLDKPWLQPYFDDQTGNVFAKYVPNVEQFIKFTDDSVARTYHKTELKRYIDHNIAKYGFFSSRKAIYDYFDIKETNKPREEHEKNKEIQWNPSVGCGLTALDYVNFFHHDTTGYISAAMNDKGKWKQYHFKTAEEVVNFVNPDTDSYISVNTMYKPNRSSENIREITCLWLDLDIYKADLSKEKAIFIIKKAVKEGVLPLPSMIVSSGNGLYMFWKLKAHAPGKVENVIGLWRGVMQGLFNKAEELGLSPDSSAMDVTRVLRMMGTTNTKSNVIAEVLEYNQGVKYSMSELGLKWYAWENKKKKTSGKKSSSRTRDNKLAYLFNPFSLVINRIKDIETICKYRGKNNIKSKNRELTLFIYRHFVTLTEGEDVALSKTLELNKQLTNPLSEKEVRIKTRTTKKMLEKIKNGDITDWNGKKKAAGYHYSNKKLIQIMNITQEEMKLLNLRTIISEDEKNERDKERKKRARRDENGLTNRQRKALEQYNNIQKLKQQGLSQTQVTEKLGLSRRTVQRNWKQPPKLLEGIDIYGFEGGRH